MMRVRSGEFFELHQTQLLARDFLPFIFWHAFHLEAERNIAECGTPREKLREILEHNAAVHSMTVDFFTANTDFPRFRGKETRDNVEKRGLATAGRADDAYELRSIDVERYILDARHFSAGRVV